MTKKNTPHGLVEDAFDLIRFTWNNKWILIALSTIAFIASVIVSSSVTPRFRSSVVLFPAASVSPSKNLLETSTISTDSRDILSFGDDEETERMLQFLHSSQIKDHIVKKFDLMTHYKISPTSSFPFTRLNKKYKANIKFKRTEYMSIEIEVLDTDAQMAADIANEISAYVDSAIHEMQQIRALEAYSIIEKEYNRSQQEISRINDSLQKIRQLGIIDYESQATSLNTAYVNALAQGNQSAVNVLQNHISILSKYGGNYVELSKKLESEMQRSGQLKNKLISAKINVEQHLPQIFIVDKAVKAERKAVPRRLITAIVTTFATFAFSLLVLLVIDRLKARS